MKKKLIKAIQCLHSSLGPQRRERGRSLWVKCLLALQAENLSSIPRSHIKTPLMVAYTWNPDPGRGGRRKSTEASGLANLDYSESPWPKRDYVSKEVGGVLEDDT